MMKNPTKFIALLSGVALLASSSFAAEVVSTDPVGYVTVELSAGADNYVSLPLFRSQVFESEVYSVVDNLVTFSAPGWDDGMFVYGDVSNPAPSNTYQLIITSGEQEGVSVKITSNDDNSVTVELTDEQLDGVRSRLADGAGDTARILPYWTLGTAFASANLPNQSQVYVYDKNTVKINKNANELYTYYDGFGWYNSMGVASDDAIIYPYEGFILRTPVGEDISDLVIAGEVPMNKSRLIAYSEGSKANDIALSSVSADGLVLGEANLGIADRTQVYVFDNSQPGFNKTASEIYTYYDGFGWFDSVGGDARAVRIPAGQAFLLRKPQTQNADFKTWKHTPAYLAN